MNTILGEILPLAVGVAVSPVPIIAVVLVLMSPSATRVAPLFLFGWVAGLVVSVGLFTALGGALPAPSDEDGRPVVATLQLVLGALLLLLALKQWKGRPRAGEEPQLPGWMAGITGVTPVRAAALAAALAAANPKNLILAAGAGTSIGRAGLGGTELLVVLVVWIALAASTVILPVLLAIVAPSRVGGALGSLREWLEANNAAVMTVLLLVLGSSLLGKGVAGF